MEEIQTIVYKTVDGTIYDNKEQAEAHEKAFENIKAFKVFTDTNLAENTQGRTLKGYLLVNTLDKQNLFAEEWCYKKYGNRVTFVMGTYASTTILEKWNVVSCELSEVDADNVLGKIQEDFAVKLW